jgi:hypothetical protein
LRLRQDRSTTIKVQGFTLDEVKEDAVSRYARGRDKEEARRAAIGSGNSGEEIGGHLQAS